MSVDFVLSPLPLYFVFENSKNTRIELARPVMETIFLVLLVIKVYTRCIISYNIIF